MVKSWTNVSSREDCSISAMVTLCWRYYHLYMYKLLLKIVPSWVTEDGVTCLINILVDVKGRYLTRGTEEPATSHLWLVANFLDFIYLFYSTHYPILRYGFRTSFEQFLHPFICQAHFEAILKLVHFFILIQAIYHCKPPNLCFKRYVYCF